MARRVSPGNRFVRGKRSATDWSASVQATSFTMVAASAVTLLEFFVPIAGGETVLRTRGHFVWMSDQSDAIESQIGAVGIGVVSEQAQSVGITAVPFPDTDAAWGGWLWHSYFASRMEFKTAAGFDPNMAHRMVIDSKAMRKVGENERLVVVVQNSSPFGIRVLHNIRILSKVH